jgi:vacuolar-type H+-ATPase subunit B/Vma2
MDNIELISSLVKILLGAVFGGLAVYFTLRDKVAEVQNTHSKRRVALLEQVAQHVGKVSHVFSKYSSLINDIGPKTEHVSVKQQQELDDLSNQLVEVYEEVSIAESKLLLLGEKRLEKALKLYTAKMAQYRKQFYPGRYNHRDEAAALKKEINQMRNQFYDILSERYDTNTK